MVLKNSVETQVVLNDLHIPYEDKECVKLCIKFIKSLKPDKIMLLGDILDFYSISHFDRNPERLLNIKGEIDLGLAFLDKLRKASPNSEIYFVEGNHEDRFRKYLWSAPAFHGLLNLRELLEIDKDYYFEYGEGFFHRKLFYTHGNRVNQHSAYTAKNMLQDVGISVIFGHTHRMGSHYKTDYSGSLESQENGCLCDFALSKEWFRKPLPNWQWGLSVVSFVEDEFNIHPICIPVQSRFILYGKRFYTL